MKTANNKRKLAWVIAACSFALLVAILAPLLFNAYADARFRDLVRPVWLEAPYVSTETPMGNDNSLVIVRSDNQLTLSGTNGTLNRTDDYRYELSCDHGEFIVMDLDDVWSELTSTVDPNRPPFEILRDSLLLGEDTTRADASLWLVRAQFMSPCETRLQHFKTPTKAGFVFGRLDAEIRMVSLFDKTGTYSVTILCREANVDDWDTFVSDICLRTE